MFKKILVAFDFSELSEVAARLALTIAIKSKASLTFSNVLTDFRSVLENMPAESRHELVAGDIEKFHKDLCASSDLKLAEFIKSLPSEGIDIQHQVLLGSPYVAITHSVQQENYDIVFSGSRDLSKIKRFLVGSTSKNLVRHCPSAVWVLKDKEHSNLRSIVAAVDLSEISSKTLKVAAWIAEQSKAALHVLHVIDSRDFPLDMFKQMTSIAGATRDWKSEVEKSGKEKLTELISNLGIKCATQSIVWGEPCEEINLEVERTNSELVVMGTVGRKGLSGLLIGNTAEKVLDSSKASVLSLKPDNVQR